MATSSMVSSPTGSYSVQNDDSGLNTLRYQALLQQTEIALCRVSDSGLVDFATPHFCRMVARSQPHVLGHTLWDVLDSVDMAIGQLQHLWSAIVHQTVTGPQQTKTYGKTGESVWQWQLQPLVQDNSVVEVQAIVTQAVGRQDNLQDDSPQPLHQLADHLQQMSWVYDVERKRLVYISPAGAALLGRSRSDCTARSWVSWMEDVHPADLESVLNASRRLLRGISCEVTYRLMASDSLPLGGDERWLMTRAVPVRNAKGRVDRIMATTEDVTDRQKQNRWLRLLESVIVNTNDAVVITEAEPVQLPGPQIVYVNPAFTRMLGYHPEEVIGQTPRILQGVNTDPQTLAHIRSNLNAWKPVVVEIINYHKNGSEVWIELSIFPVTDPAGHPNYWVAIQRDITDRKQADATRQRQALQSQILTDLTLKIRRSLQLDDILHTTITEVRSLLKVDRVLLFRRLGNGRGQVYSESVKPDIPSLLGQEIEEADFFAEPVQLYERSTVQTLERLNEDHWQSRGANYLQALGIRSLMASPIAQQNRIWGWLIAHQTSHRHWSSFEVDLLQQLPAPLEVAITQGQLVQALQDSEERFRTLANRETPDKPTEQIQRLQNAAVDMDNLLSDILLIERADAKKLKFEPTEVEVRSLCQDVIDELAWSASVSDTLQFQRLHNSDESGREKCRLDEITRFPEFLEIVNEFGCSSIQFLLQSNQGLVLATVDEQSIRQILMNLLTNAIKYSDPGHPVRLSLTATSNKFKLIVQDWGMGIPSADQERLFEPFYRASNVKSVPGNGLGLAIVQQSVEAHQGDIKICSTLGEGTTVTVELPRWISN